MKVEYVAEHAGTHSIAANGAYSGSHKGKLERAQALCERHATLRSKARQQDGMKRNELLGGRKQDKRIRLRSANTSALSLFMHARAHRPFQ